MLGSTKIQSFLRPVVSMATVGCIQLIMNFNVLYNSKMFMSHYTKHKKIALYLCDVECSLYAANMCCLYWLMSKATLAYGRTEYI